MGIYDGALLTHIGTGELTELSEVMLTVGSKLGVLVLLMEFEILPEGLIVGPMPDVEFVVTFGTAFGMP